jgi:predicted nucleic acid-binding Zn ribbon protein
MGRRAPKSGTLQPVAPILAQTLRQAGLERVTLLAQLVRHWEDIVGSQIAAVARPDGMRGRVLFVTVTDAIWLQQLTFYQARVLHNIRRVLGDVPIGKLHFMVASSSQAASPRTEGVPELLPLTTAEERQVLEGTAEIVDTDLREVVRQAWRRGWQLRR